MANEEQLAILRQGAIAWNLWRKEHPFINPNFSGATLANIDLSEAVLYGANFAGALLQQTDLTRAILYGTNFSGAVLQDVICAGVDLSGAVLQKADLEGTVLEWANLVGANLQEANLRRANLAGAFLEGVDLSGANLQEADFRRANLRRAQLQRANMMGARIGGTVLGEVDLREVQALRTVQHKGPSTLGIDTLYRSQGDIPEVFLRGCGVPDSMIEYARALVAAERPIDYYSCFISYSSRDEAVAERLYADLQARGVRCWYASHDLQIGEPILSGIDTGIRLHDKLLLILSESSVSSAWVEQEVQMALSRERNERRRVLFPIRIDDAILTHPAGWPALVRNERHIGDFRQWKDHDAYQATFARLLRDLKAEQR
jgi:uncharacterized protein YjbI with pentapeptide repeats